MRRPVPRIFKFDDRDPGKHVLYPMPLPHGPRVIAVTDGLSTNVLLTDGTQTTTSLNGFVPHIETAITALYNVMLSEPQPGITESGLLKYRPGMVYDLVLHDRRGCGDAKLTEAALDEWLFDESLTADEEAVCALVLAAVPVEAYKRGKDDCDLWLRRSHVKRGCQRLGMNNTGINPYPVLRALAIAPPSWSTPDSGCAGQSGEAFWRQVDNCFKHDYLGCLIVDVMQPWNVKGNHFQLIREEDSI